MTDTKRVYDNTNSGILAVNKMKQKDTHPDARGRCNIDGKWYWISGWRKFNSNDGSKFQSLAFTPFTDEDVAKYIDKVAPKKEAVEEVDEDDVI